MTSDAWWPPGVASSTFSALASPKRLVPILLVCAPLVLLQVRTTREPLAGPIGIAMCVTFVLAAPLSFRALFPEGTPAERLPAALVLYGLLGACLVLVVGLVLPRFLGMGWTLLTSPSSLVVCVTLFLVGGWGLGRDIGFEVSLDRARARVRALAREAEQAQLLALRSHLDPHFLFNTLNAIAELCREDGEAAERAVLQLSAILRNVLEGVRASTWPLGRELDLARDLLALHLARDPELFALDVSVDARARAVPVPPMIFLPLVENAVKHGPAAGHRGRLGLSARFEEALAAAPAGGRVRLRISNPGPYAGPRRGSDGLPTVKRRLALAYGDAASLAIGPEPGALEPRTFAELSLGAAGPDPETRA